MVGVGDSGAEIALEVATSHPTWLSGKEIRPCPVPYRLLRRPGYLFQPLLFRFIGHRLLTVNTPIGRKMRPELLSHAAPLVRVKPKGLAAAGVGVPRTVGVRRATAVGGPTGPRGGQRRSGVRVSVPTSHGSTFPSSGKQSRYTIAG